jgi:hypothetical protein
MALGFEFAWVRGLEHGLGFWIWAGAFSSLWVLGVMESGIQFLVWFFKKIN